MSISKTLLATSIAAMLGIASFSANAADEPGKLTMRLRAIHIVPADKSDAALGGALPKDGVDVSNKWAPDIDFEYAVMPHVGVELLLTIPQRHTVVAHTTGGDVNLGTVQHLPPTLTAKYYILTNAVRLYVGAGLNFTWFTEDDLALGATKLTIKRTSLGLALQAGVDVSLTDRMSLSFDAKKADISTNVYAGGTKVTTVSVDPYIYGVGVGYRF